MDVNREIRMAVNTGTVDFGIKESKNNAEEEECELLVVASNCPDESLKDGKEYEGVPIYTYKGNNKQLGSAAGKPFAVSTLSIKDAGNSNILSLRAE
ncbi:MAG: 50S ribosomal protein L30e [Candidatus Thermoplasmatota archaeon]|nr:50S ribosomal protein L30e [Candidatus Thermoplasmatota archaeon]MBS3789544.1 50S ribosomal protein L30e [Candidatus Thermoplasmatota archaeon]